MKDLKELKFVLGESYKSPFVNEIGVFQDGTVPLARDKNGKLWALSGHSHCGHIGVFCGDTLSDMKEVYPATFLFCTGRADYAFSGIKYPEGDKLARKRMAVRAVYMQRNGAFLRLFS